MTFFLTLKSCFWVPRCLGSLKFSFWASRFLECLACWCWASRFLFFLSYYFCHLGFWSLKILVLGSLKSFNIEFWAFLEPVNIYEEVSSIWIMACIYKYFQIRPADLPILTWQLCSNKWSSQPPSHQAKVMFWMKGQCQQFSWAGAKRIGPTYSLGVLAALAIGWEELCPTTILECCIYNIIQLLPFHSDSNKDIPHSNTK